jgi:hypothetical protein
MTPQFMADVEAAASISTVRMSVPDAAVRMQRPTVSTTSGTIPEAYTPSGSTPEVTMATLLPAGEAIGVGPSGGADGVGVCGSAPLCGDAVGCIGAGVAVEDASISVLDDGAQPDITAVASAMLRTVTRTVARGTSPPYPRTFSVSGICEAGD